MQLTETVIHTADLDVATVAPQGGALYEGEASTVGMPVGWWPTTIQLAGALPAALVTLTLIAKDDKVAVYTSGIHAIRVELLND
jgi:hypothetical protein